MTDCPCCSYAMVRCVHHHQVVWFCRHCWQEMPDLAAYITYSLPKLRSLEPTAQQSISQQLVLAS